ncbi:hypothetical protein N219_13065 (plasmid) [Limosilactobacillus fermentum MTCC 8711]|nr:hypothetical protein N219_13065 [Limosilactobacillus fermentum MTCC 8711]
MLMLEIMSIAFYSFKHSNQKAPSLDMLQFSF